MSKVDGETTMTQQDQSPVVTDEMIERAAKELSQHLYTRFGQPDNEAYEEMSTADRLCYQRSARAALEAALPSEVRVKPEEIQLLMRLRDNQQSGVHDVIEGDHEKWETGRALSDRGLIAIVAHSKGGIFHITRLGLKVLGAAIEPTQAPEGEAKVGIIAHIDHGKTILTAAITQVLAKQPAPAPAELEVVGYEAWSDNKDEWVLTRDDDPRRDQRPLVRLTDAQAAIAAKDAEIEGWKDLAGKRGQDRREMYERAKAAEARVAELEEEVKLLRKERVQLQGENESLRHDLKEKDHD